MRGARGSRLRRKMPGTRAAVHQTPARKNQPPAAATASAPPARPPQRTPRRPPPHPRKDTRPKATLFGSIGGRTAAQEPSCQRSCPPIHDAPRARSLDPSSRRPSSTFEDTVSLLLSSRVTT